MVDSNFCGTGTVGLKHMALKTTNLKVQIEIKNLEKNIVIILTGHQLQSYNLVEVRLL